VHLRVILPDLPAHGARFKEALSLGSAVATLHDVITREVPGKKVKEPLLVILLQGHAV